MPRKPRYNMATVEDLLYKQVVDRKEKNMIGAGSCKELRKELVEHIKISIVKNFMLSNQHILLGAWAYEWYKSGGDPCANREKVQVMSVLTPDNFLKAIKSYVAEIADANIYMKEQELFIPKDFRTKRFTFYITSKGQHGIIDKPFLDLFNCANFEIIPYNIIHNIFIASKWVLLRFMFIDVWIIRFIKNIGILDQNTLNTKLTAMWNIIDYFKTIDPSTDPSRYLGTYINYDVAKKMEALKQTKYFQPYYPEEYMNKHKKYREL